MQRTEVIGHIGRDAEVKDFGTNQVINFTVAVSEKINNEEKTTWFDVQKWGNSTTIAQYLKKGTKVFVSGKPANRAYLNNQSGEAMVVNGINAFQIELLGSAQQNTQQAAPQSNGAPQNYGPPAGNQSPPQSNSPADEHDDLPF